MIATNTQTIKGIIEHVTSKRNLPTNVRLAELIELRDLPTINTKLTDLYHHHMEVYLVDTIEDVARILTGKF